MAQQENQDSGTEGENPLASLLFIQKKVVGQADLIEAVKQSDYFDRTVNALKEMWETMSNVFSQREEISIARKEALIRQAKEKKVDSISVAPGKIKRSEDSAVTGIELDELTTKRYYEMWSNELKKNIEHQRRNARQSVEKWLTFLRGFDPEERLPSNNSPTWWEAIWYVFMIIFCAMHIPSFFGAESTSQQDPLVIFYEKILESIVGAYKFYLSFHNITIDHTENASYWINSSDSSV